VSDLMLQVMALQWFQLTEFAKFIAEEFPGAPLAHDPERTTRRYLLYFHEMTEESWREVEQYRAAHPEVMQIPASPPSADVPEFEISSVAMQWRMCFGFAAQFTAYAESLTDTYLRDHHGLSGPEWEHVRGFIDGQEEFQR
jgi:hypothetical protein